MNVSTGTGTLVHELVHALIVPLGKELKQRIVQLAGGTGGIHRIFGLSESEQRIKIGAAAPTFKQCRRIRTRVFLQIVQQFDQHGNSRTIDTRELLR